MGGAVAMVCLMMVGGVAHAPEGTADRRCALDIGGPIKVDIVVPEGIAPGATVPVEGTIRLHRDVTTLAVRVETQGEVGTGALPGVSGPLFSGDVVSFNTTATYGGPGRASVTIVAEGKDETGRTIDFARGTLFALVRADRSFAGIGDFKSLELAALRARATTSFMTAADEEMERLNLVRLQRSATPVDIVRQPVGPEQMRLNTLVGAPPQGNAASTEGAPDTAVAGTITINGNVQWQDENGGWHPVYGARIDIYDDDLGPDEFVDNTITDTNGDYSISVNNDDGIGAGDRDIYVRYLTRNSFVICQDDGGDVYFAESGTHDETPSGTTITEDFAFPMGGDNDANSIFQAGTWIAAYVAFDAEGAALPQVDLVWPNGDDHSFYNGAVRIEEPDRYDWDTVHHEFGHYVTDSLNIEDNPGGPHNIGDCIVDEHGDDKSEGNRLAWGEGWPTYFGTSGQRELNLASLNVPRVGDVLYEDLEDGSLSYSLDTQDNNGRGEDNEVAVQRLLWDLYDSGSEGRDAISRSDNSIWNAIKGAAGAPHILSHYWGALRSGQSDQTQILMGEIASDQQIGPQLTSPAQGGVVSPSNRNFSWKGLVGCPSSYTGDLFDLVFYNAATFAKLLTVPGIGTTSHTLSLANLQSLSTTTHNVLWGVEGSHTPGPATGPYLGETFAITVNQPPVADAGTDIIAECTSPTTTPVMLNGTGSSDPDGDALTYTWSAPGVAFDNNHLATPTGQFPIATKTATLVVSDGIATDDDTVDVTVHDTTAPVIACPGDIVVECSASGGTPASDPQLDPFFNGVSATDICDTTPAITNNAPGFFPLGDTIVTFTATDDSLNASNCQAKVTVQDTTPPVIDATVNPLALWPPNHTLRTITATITVSDICDPNPAVRLFSIVSNEPDNGLGDGDTANDIQDAAINTDDREFLLRSERAGKGNGRLYSILYEAEDQSANKAQDGATVLVPHRSILQLNSIRMNSLGGGAKSGAPGLPGVGATAPVGGSQPAAGSPRIGKQRKPVREKSK